MKTYRKALFIGCVLALALSALPAPQSAIAQGGTVIVSPGNLAGWVIQPYPTPTAVPYQFVDGVAALGSGSLSLGPISGVGTNKLILYSPYVNQPASAFRSFSYGYYVDLTSSAVGTNSNHLYANVYVDLSSNGIGTYATWYDCRYDFVPPPITAGAWGMANITDTTTTWVNIADPGGLGCPTSLGALAAGSLIMNIVLNGGDTSTNDNGLLAYFDAVTITTTAGSTTYDFEAFGGGGGGATAFGYADGRINHLDIAAPVAAYAWDWGVDARGQRRFGLILYGIDAQSQGYEVLRITPQQIAAVPERPAQNTLIAQTTVNQMHISVWRLSSGEFHVQVRKPNGKRYVLIFERIIPERQVYTSFEQD